MFKLLLFSLSCSLLLLLLVHLFVISLSIYPRFQLYDYESGEFERTLKGHTNSVQDLAFSPDGTQLGLSSLSPLSLSLSSLSLCHTHTQSHSVSVSLPLFVCLPLFLYLSVCLSVFLYKKEGEGLRMFIENE